MQMEAQPREASFCMSTFMRVPVMRAPEQLRAQEADADRVSASRGAEHPPRRREVARGWNTYPMGCPSATAPPLTLTREWSRPMSCMLASATTEKASLISWKSMSLALTPAFLSATGTAIAGAVVNMTGSCAASPNPGVAQHCV